MYCTQNQIACMKPWLNLIVNISKITLAMVDNFAMPGLPSKWCNLRQSHDWGISPVQSHQIIEYENACHISRKHIGSKRRPLEQGWQSM